MSAFNGEGHSVVRLNLFGITGAATTAFPDIMERYDAASISLESRVLRRRPPHFQQYKQESASISLESRVLRRGS